MDSGATILRFDGASTTIAYPHDELGLLVTDDVVAQESALPLSPVIIDGVVVNPTGPEKAVWLGGTGLYVDRLTVGEKRVIRGGSWVATETSMTTTHRFWNHPLNNSYGVGLGFRCAKTATQEPEQYVQYHFIQTLISMGEEKWKEALDSIDKALKQDPDNPEFKKTREFIQKQM